MKLTSRVKSLAFERNTTVLAVSDESGNTVLWEWRSGNRMDLNDASIGEVSSLTFSLGGDTLVTGHKDGSIGLWLWKKNINSPVLRMRYHEGPVNSIAFSLDGRMMASGSSDQSIRLWDMQHLAEVPPLALKGHELWVFSVAFNPSGNLLVSAGADNTVRIWFTKYEHLANMLYEKLGSEPNESEKEQLSKITGLNFNNLNFFQRSRAQY